MTQNMKVQSGHRRHQEDGKQVERNRKEKTVGIKYGLDGGEEMGGGRIRGEEDNIWSYSPDHGSSDLLP